MLTKRLSEALALAVQAHDGQIRKGTTIPYLAHPMGVASIALDHGADEDQAIAALLHDAVEDGGIEYASLIRCQFGDRVADIVQGCTDGVSDNQGRKSPWLERKQAYLVHLQQASDDVLLVSGSDKLHNARAIVGDLMRSGAVVFDRFTASQEQTLWYYESLARIFEHRKVPMANALREAVDAMHRLAQRS